MLFLRDIYEAKVKRGDADAAQFRTLVRGELAYGLNATAIGAANSIRRWIERRRPEDSDLKREWLRAALADIEAALNPVAKAA